MRVLRLTERETWVDALVAKLPDFDLLWPAELKAEWFAAALQILTLPEAHKAKRRTCGEVHPEYDVFHPEGHGPETETGGSR